MSKVPEQDSAPDFRTDRVALRLDTILEQLEAAVDALREVVTHQSQTENPDEHP